MEEQITLHWQGVLVGGAPPTDPDSMVNLPSFIGSMQKFIMNKINYFDMAKISARGCTFFFLSKRVDEFSRTNDFLFLFRSFGRFAQSVYDF